MTKAPPYSAAEVESIRLPGGATERDAVAAEELLEIRINGEPIPVTTTTKNWRSASALPQDRGITLCGFVRHGKINVYSEPWRIQA